MNNYLNRNIILAIFRTFWLGGREYTSNHNVLKIAKIMFLFK